MGEADALIGGEPCAVAIRPAVMERLSGKFQRMD
jgi:hypothetical protein